MSSADPLTPAPALDAEDRSFQHRHLLRVSRTFALNIPELSIALREAVGNAYLLCRIADTIEDAGALDVEQKQQALADFARVVAGHAGALEFAEVWAPRLGAHTSEDDRALIAESARVVGLTGRLHPGHRRAIERCIAIMTAGMADFAGRAGPQGLADRVAFDGYCYAVAGVVGEMLFDQFAVDAPGLEPARERLYPWARRFGRGLQTVNVLKDRARDAERGIRWLPIDHGDDATARALLIPQACDDLRAGLAFCLRLPAERTDLRRFCLQPIALALLTLHEIAVGDDRRPPKISRRRLALTIAAVRRHARDDQRLRALFERLAAPLERPPSAPNDARGQVSQAG